MGKVRRANGAYTVVGKNGIIGNLPAESTTSPVSGADLGSVLVDDSGGHSVTEDYAGLHAAMTHRMSPDAASPSPRTVVLVDASGEEYMESLDVFLLNTRRQAQRYERLDERYAPKRPTELTEARADMIVDLYASGPPDQSYREEAARDVALMSHYGQADQLGVPYIHHPAGVVCELVQLPQYKSLSVEEQGIARQAAWLHDVAEDTPMSLERLSAAGFDSRVTDAVDSVSSRAGEPKDDYYERVKAGGPIAVAVKLADLSHNNLPERRESLPGSPSNPVRDGEEDRFTKLGRKYFKAYTALGGDVPPHLQQFAPVND